MYPSSRFMSKLKFRYLPWALDNAGQDAPKKLPFFFVTLNDGFLNRKATFE
jgi:hypothetical protein